MTMPPLAHFPTTAAYRIIPSRFPPVDLYREVAPAEDWELLQRHAMQTNRRLVETSYPSGLIRQEDRIERSSSNYIIGPLSRPNTTGSRFSDGSFGIVYVGLDFDTAQAEVIAQRERFLKATSQKPQRLDMRVVKMDLEGDLHDLRSYPSERLSNLDETRAIGRGLRTADSFGLVFKSTIRPGGECAAVFRPTVLSNCRQERHVGFVWNGREISEVIEYTLQANKPPNFIASRRH